MRESLIWNELGNLYLKVEAFDEAITAFQQAIELNPDSGWCYVNLGHAYSQKGDHDKALALYHKSIPLVKDDRQKAVLWNRLGDSYRARRDFTQAMAAYKMADDLETHAPEAGTAGNQVLSSAAPRTASQAAAMPAAVGSAVLSRPAGETPTRPVPAPRTALPSGYAQRSASQAARPAGVERSTAPLNASSLPPMPRSERPAEAGRDPVGNELYQIKAKGLHVFIADPPSAAQLQGMRSQEALPADPQPVQAPTPARQVSERQERETAEILTKIDIYEKISAINPTNDRAWDTLGKLYKSIGRYEQAGAAFERAITICPNREAYYYHLGLVYSVEKMLERAIWAFENVIRICPEYVLAHGALAGIYRRMGQEAKANNHISIALPMMDSESAYNRACFHAICGNHDQAIELLQQALNNHDTTTEWIESDPDLDLLRSDPRYQALIKQNNAGPGLPDGQDYAEDQTKPNAAIHTYNGSLVR